MSPVVRTVLVTGPGGSGRTTAAAATALAAARRGQRVLLLTTDRPGTLGAALGTVLPEARAGRPEGQAGARPEAQAAPRVDGADGADGADADPHAPARGPVPYAPADAPWTPPVQAAPGLWAARVDSGEHFREELLALQGGGSAALDLLGAAPLDRDELTAVPGTDALGLLRALRAVHDLAATGPGTDGAAEARTAADAAAGPTAPDRTSASPAGPPAAWDLVVVDLPPVPEAPAVLALPEQLGRYLRRLLPPQRQAARALRPVLAQLAGVPMPSPWLYETSARWQDELAAAQAVIAAGTTTLRLVVEPGPAGSDALRRIRPGLALHGHRVEAVVANRLLPTGSTDPWLAALSGRQQSALKSLHEDWGPGTDVLELPHLGHDPRGTADLAPLADALGRAPVGPGGATPWPVEDLRDGEGVLVWRIPLPGAARDDLGLVRLGDELVLRVGPFRRIVPLPSALRRCAVSGAGLTDGELRVRFTPDPALWPRTP